MAKFCSSGGASWSRYRHQCLKQCGFALLPEGISGLGTFGCGVLYQIGNKTEHVFVIVDILEWIVAKRCVGIDEVKDTHLISLFLQQAPCLSEQLRFGVCNDHRTAALHDVWQGKASGFSCTGAPTTRMLRHLRCLWVSRLMRKFCVSRMFWEYGFLLYFLQICRASPHLAEPCSSPLR